MTTNVREETMKRRRVVTTCRAFIFAGNGIVAAVVIVV